MNKNFFKFMVIHGENLLFLKSIELLEYCTPVLMSMNKPTRTNSHEIGCRSWHRTEN